MPDIPLDDVADVEQWYFAVCGLDTQKELLDIGGPFHLRRLRSFPTHEQLAQSLTSLPVAGVMALFGERLVRHELVIDAARFEENIDRIFPTASAILAGLRIRTGAEILCPAVCENSWSSLKASPPNQTRAFHFERGYADGLEKKPRMLLPEDVDWVKHNLGTIVERTEDESFETAVEALCTYMSASNDRMKVAQLWAGVESLFDIEQEVSYRLAILAAKFLGTNPNESREIYREMRSLYKQRSKITHGKTLAKRRDDHDEMVAEHIMRVRGRLAQVLRKLVALDRVPNEQVFEEMLFANQLQDPKLRRKLTRIVRKFVDVGSAPTETDIENELADHGNPDASDN